MLKKSLLILASVAIIFCAFVAMQPSEFSVSRSIKIAAAPSQVFPHVNNQKNWNDWSPWAKLDPQMTQTFEGPDAGVGSIVKWSGNKNVGKGSSEIVESKENEFVKFKLNFEEPMKSEHSADFTFASSADNETTVTWTMSGQKNFAMKAMGMFCNCNEKVGAMFEEGLFNLKNVAEKNAAEKVEVKKAKK